MAVLQAPQMLDAGFPHGFLDRNGGVSTGPFDSLNFGSLAPPTPSNEHLHDDPQRVAANRRVACEWVGLAATTPVAEVRQTHSAEIRVLGPGQDPAPLSQELADGLIALPGAFPVAVRTADCVPVLLADPTSSIVAAVHAGWRGIVAGIVPLALDQMVGLGAKRESVLVAIGPHIRPRVFEVGPEVAGKLADASSPEVHFRWPNHPSGMHVVDMARALRHQLGKAGIDHGRLFDTGGCSFSEKDRFFSHRRDKGVTGRHWALIAPGKPQ